MAAQTDVCYLGIRDLAALYRKGALSPVEATRMHLERIRSLNDRLHAYLIVTEGLALELAGKSEKRFVDGSPLGLLDGIPVGVKDTYDTCGIATTAGSAVFAQRIPNRNATAVTRLLSSGAVLLGKLTMTEFAAGLASPSDSPPPARNPWDLNLSPGASSSGPAVAVAAGMSVASLGTDTGGSIRGPASYCGVVGLKPTFGLVGRSGCVPLSWSLDHCGPLTRSVEDCAIMLQALAGYDPEDAMSVDVALRGFTAELEQPILSHIKIGVPRHLIESVGELDTEVEAAFDCALNTLSQCGASVEDVRLPEMEYEPAVFATIMSVEALAFHEPLVARYAELYGRSFYMRLVAGSLFSGVDYVQALRGRSFIREAVDRVMESVEVLALPTSRFPPLPFGVETGAWAHPSLCHPFNTTKQPAISVPCGFTRAGLPLGLQLVGRCFEESTLLAVARGYERTSNASAHPALD